MLMRTARGPLVAGLLAITAAPIAAQQAVNLPARDKALTEKPATLFTYGKEEGANHELLAGVRAVASGMLVAAWGLERPPLEALGAIRFDAPYLAQRDALVEAFTRKYVTSLLLQTNGNQSEAARISGLDRTYFGRMLAKLGMSRGTRGEGPDRAS